MVITSFYNSNSHICSFANFSCSFQVAAFVQGSDEKGRLVRRALVRYLNAIFALTFQATSPVIRQRFPTLAHLEEAGFFTQEVCIFSFNGFLPPASS